MRVARWLAVILALLLPGVILLPVWPLAGLGAGEDEILYYFPTRLLAARTILDGDWPWLNPCNGLDRPLFADPQAALLYPPTWLMLLLPPTVAYGALVWLHYTWAWLGLHTFLRRLDTSSIAALFGATAFAFCGFLLAHRAHLTMLQSAAWLPWICLALDRYVATGRSRHLLLAACCCAAQCFAGHVQIAALSAIASLVLVIGRERAVRRWLLAWLSAGGLFAVQAIPTWRFLQTCTRGERGYSDFIENFWHPLSAIGLVFPMFLGQRTPNLFPVPYWGPSHQVEQFAYPGLAVLALLIVAWPLRRRPDMLRWWLLLGLSLGIATSLLCPLLYWLPGANLLRVPARALLLANFAAAVLAARMVDLLDGRRSPALSEARALGRSLSARPGLLAVDLAIFAIVAGLVAYPWLSGASAGYAAWAIRPWNPGVFVPVALCFGTLAAVGWVLRGWETPQRRWALLGVLALDLAIIGWTIDVPRGWRSAESLLTSGAREAWLTEVLPTRERVWVVTERDAGTPGEYIAPVARGVACTNLLEPFAALTDYGPLQPRRFVDAFGFEPWGERKNPEDLLADESLLAACNVGWVLLCGESLPAPVGSYLIYETVTGSRLYRMPNARGGAFVEPGDVPSSVYVEDLGPNRCRISVDGWAPLAPDTPVTLVISRLAQPGWTATMNGAPLPLQAWNDLLLAARIPGGQALTIELRYAPPGLATGLCISMVTAMLLGVAGWRNPAQASGQ